MNESLKLSIRVNNPFQGHNEEIHSLNLEKDFLPEDNQKINEDELLGTDSTRTGIAGLAGWTDWNSPVNPEKLNYQNYQKFLNFFGKKNEYRHINGKV